MIALGMIETLEREAVEYGAGPEELGVYVSPSLLLPFFNPRTAAGQRAAEDYWEQRSLRMHAKQAEDERAFKEAYGLAQPEATAEAKPDDTGRTYSKPFGVIVV